MWFDELAGVHIPGFIEFQANIAWRSGIEIVKGSGDEQWECFKRDCLPREPTMYPTSPLPEEIEDCDHEEISTLVAQHSQMANELHEVSGELNQCRVNIGVVESNLQVCLGANDAACTDLDWLDSNSKGCTFMPNMKRMVLMTLDMEYIY
eukprot:UN23303